MILHNTLESLLKEFVEARRKMAYVNENPDRREWEEYVASRAAFDETSERLADAIIALETEEQESK